MIYFLLGAVSIVVVAVLYGFIRLRAVRAQLTALREKLFQHPQNVQSLGGLQSLLTKWQLDPNPRFAKLTAIDVARIRRTIGQLYAPSDEIFPILKKDLPQRCLYKVLACPALVHPTTGVLFGMRIGTYLCVLRLSDPSIAQGLAENTLWAKSPLQNAKDLNLAELFGKAWVIPNTAAQNIALYYSQAYEFAGATS